MVPLGELRCGPSVGGHVPHSSVPDVNNIIIRATRETVSIWPPSQSADVSSVTLQDANFMLGNAHIVVPDAPILAAAAQHMTIPAQRRDACLVAAHRPQPPVRLDIPQFYVSIAEPDRDVRAVAGPIEGADVVPLWRLGEVRDSPSLRVPDIRVLRERDGEDVARRPGEQVEVVVVDHGRRVEDAVRLRGEASLPWASVAARATARAARRRLFARVQRLDIDPLGVEGRVLDGRRGLAEGEDACGGIDAHSFGESLNVRRGIVLGGVERAGSERGSLWIRLHDESVRLRPLSEKK